MVFIRKVAMIRTTNSKWDGKTLRFQEIITVITYNKQLLLVILFNWKPAK